MSDRSDQDSGSPVWLVTGASSGFGRVICNTLVARGYRVVATAREPRTLAEFAAQHGDSVLTIALDVTSEASVTAGVAAAIERFGRIDVLVNNAGHGFIGALEEVSDRDTRALAEVNVFGVLSVTRAVLPHMRAQRSGHIIQMSSVGGQVANPGHAMYAMTKFALEGMSEALRGEVAPLGIRVTIVEPGPFRTDFAGRSIGFSDPIDDYVGTPAGDLRKRFSDQDGEQPNDPVRAAELIVASDADQDAPMRMPLGPEAVRRIREKLAAQVDELDRWESTLVATGFR